MVMKELKKFGISMNFGSMNNMEKLLLSLIFISFSTVIQAEAIKCYTKNEVGEMSFGEDYIFERTNELDKSKPAILDFDELKIINADTGKFFNMTKESDNHFKSGDYHYLTNDIRTVVIEAVFNSTSGGDLVFSKILMCEPF